MSLMSWHKTGKNCHRVIAPFQPVSMSCITTLLQEPNYAGCSQSHRGTCILSTFQRSYARWEWNSWELNHCINSGTHMLTWC